jgi:hypothetical protein
MSNNSTNSEPLTATYECDVCGFAAPIHSPMPPQDIWCPECDGFQRFERRDTNDIADCDSSEY